MYMSMNDQARVLHHIIIEGLHTHKMILESFIPVRNHIQPQETLEYNFVSIM